jgi:hypothetical protein
MPNARPVTKAQMDEEPGASAGNGRFGLQTWDIKDQAQCPGVVDQVPGHWEPLDEMIRGRKRPVPIQQVELSCGGRYACWVQGPVKNPPVWGGTDSTEETRSRRIVRDARIDQMRKGPGQAKHGTVWYCKCQGWGHPGPAHKNQVVPENIEGRMHGASLRQ